MRRRWIGPSLAACVLVALALPAIALAEYGAIAVNKRTGALGVGVAPLRGSAERTAKQLCGRHCVVAAWAENTCAALVHIKRRYWAGFGPTGPAAVSDARGLAGHPHARFEDWLCPPTGDAPIVYGAIALNFRTGQTALGFAATKSWAERAAKQTCGKRCATALWVRGECGAVVHVKRHYWAGFGSAQTAAIQSALQAAANPRARVLQTICVTPT